MSSCCLICSSSVNKILKRSDQDGFEGRCAASAGGGGVSNELDVIFALRNVLEIPSDLCQSFLISKGSPSEWGIQICSLCRSSFILPSKLISSQMCKLEKDLKEIKTQVVNRLTQDYFQKQISENAGNNNGRPAAPKPRGKRKNKSDNINVPTQVRSWIVEKYQASLSEFEDDQLEKAIAASGGVHKYMALKRAEGAFQGAGEGRRLVDDSVPGPSSSSLNNHMNNNKSTSGGSTTSNNNAKSLSSGGVLSEEKQAAAAAALLRLTKNRKPDDSAQILAHRQTAFIKEQAKKELEQEAKSKGSINNHDESKSTPNGQVQISVDRKQENEVKVESHKIIDPSSYVVKGVFFRSSLIGPELLEEKEAERKIREFLFKQLKDDPDVTSCLLIHSCNKPQERVRLCVETLTKYLDNIINNPNEVKYRQIRCSNPAFRDRVASITGGEQFLKAAGFRKVWMPIDTWDEQEEEFWSFNPDNSNDEDSSDDEDNQTPSIAKLIELRDKLKSTRGIFAELDRNVQLLLLNEVSTRNELPDEFYNLSPEEIKREQNKKREKVELELTLRTKEMRERDDKASSTSNIYRFCVLRFKFPDQFTLQGTFRSGEKLSDVIEFVRSNLANREFEFSLIKPGGGNLLTSYGVESRLGEMGLLPSALINFQPTKGPSTTAHAISYLHPNILSLLSFNSLD